MSRLFRLAITVQFVGLALVASSAQVGNCPSRPLLEDTGTVISNPLDLYSQNGVLTLALAMNDGVDSDGYTHFCYNYTTDSGTIEAPTWRLNPGDTLNLTLTNDLAPPTGPNAARKIQPKAGRKTQSMHMGPMKYRLRLLPWSLPVMAAW